MWTAIAIIIVALGGGLYPVYIGPLLRHAGVGRVIQSVGNGDCTTVPELQACEKIVLHPPSGLLYLACSTPSSRTAWMPALNRFNPAGAGNDYVATYDPALAKVTKFKVINYTDSRGLSLHGMDVVPSASDPSQLFVFLVNHRPPHDVNAAPQVGADSSIEIFKTFLGSKTLTHIRTVENHVIDTPNDVVGDSTGESFYFTNDHSEKVGFLRQFDPFGRSVSSVGYCHIEHGCFHAISGMHGNNGITRAQNDTFYVANSFSGGITILERQTDNTLIPVDSLKLDHVVDNLALDSDGILWAAGIPKPLTFVFRHAEDPSVPSPASAYRISLNTGTSAFYGEKFKLEKVFEDDGTVASGITSVVHDVKHSVLYLHGLFAPHLAICRII